MVNARPRRRWFAFSLRTLLLLVTACAIWLGWWVNSARNQQASVAAIKDHNNQHRVFYQFQLDALQMAVRTGVVPHKPASRTPAFLENRLGPDYFHDVVTVCFMKRYEPASDDRALWRAADGLRGLEQLTSHIAPLDGDLASLPKLRRLKHLMLMNCSDLTDQSLQTIGRIGSLESLTIAGGKFTDAGFSQLSNLRRLKRLHLSDRMNRSANPERAVDVADADVLQIARMTGLEDVMISSKILTNEGLSHLSSLVNLRELDLSSTNVTDEGIVYLSDLPNLTSLRLNCPQLSDEGLRFIARIPSLERLEIRGSNITGVGFQYFAKEATLDTVIVEGKNVRDEAIWHLAVLSNLCTLQLENTRVTAIDLEPLQFAPKLKQLAIRPQVLDISLKLVLKRVAILNGELLFQ